MSSLPPKSDDPLAALAQATHQAVRAENASRAAELAAKRDEAAGTRRVVRAISVVVLVAIIGLIVFVQGPRIADPYYGEDPLGDPRRAHAYVASLLDLVFEWRAVHDGRLPTFLGEAVPQNRLPDSPYQVQYRVENGTPVLTLEGGREPVVVRGTAK